MNEDRFWQIIDTAWNSSSELKSFQDQVLTSAESDEAKEAFEETFNGDPCLRLLLAENATRAWPNAFTESAARSAPRPGSNPPPTSRGPDCKPR